MAIIHQRGPEARARLTIINRGYLDRAPYREALAGLAADQNLELEPDADETLRQLKSLMRRAANEIGRSIQYGETEQGSLLVWIVPAPLTRARRSAS